MIRTILVPLDGSAFGEQALPWAALLARRADAQLHLAHVLVPVIVGDPLLQYTTVDVETPDEARAYLADLWRRCPQAAELRPPAPGVLDGPVTIALQDYARTHQVDLIVMATHGRGPLARWWDGSVHDDMVRALPVPLLLIRAADEGLILALPNDGFRHVLIAVDGTPASEAVMTPALELARLFGAAVSLLRVVPPARAPVEKSTQPPPVIEMHLGERTDDWLTPEKELDRLALQVRANQLVVQPLIVEHDRPEEAILTEAKRLDCDLIALETHGRAGLSRLFHGSVADKVLRRSECPVLIHRTEPGESR